MNAHYSINQTLAHALMRGNVLTIRLSPLAATTHSVN